MHMLTSLISKLWGAGLRIFSKWKPAGIPDNQFECYDWSQEGCFGGLLLYCVGCRREITPQISECMVHWLRCCVVTDELMRWRLALNLEKQNSSWSFQEVKYHATALDQFTCTRFISGSHGTHATAVWGIKLPLCSMYIEIILLYTISTQIILLYTMHPTSSSLLAGELLHWRAMKVGSTCHNNWEAR